MKMLKALVVTLIALLVSGCYTQLQYSQKMKKITDKEEAVQGQASGEYEAVPEQEYADEGEYYGKEEEYIPVYYKDYTYEQKYNECGCNPYKVYNFYGPTYGTYDAYPYSSFRSHLSLSPFYYHKWHHRRFYENPWYYGSGFSFSLFWGYPSYYHGFYDPYYYDPFYDHYWGYGYHRPYGFNLVYFYRNYGHGYYYDKDRVNRNSRYGPRSIGSSRVDSGNRARNSRTISGRSAVTNRSGVRTMPKVSSPRSRGTVSRGTSGSSTVTRTRNRGSSSKGSGSSSGRSRSRDNMQQSVSDNNSNGILRTRSTTVNRNKNTDSNRYTPFRVQGSSNSEVKRTGSRTTFFDRVKSFVNDNVSRIGNNINHSGSSIKFRSRSSSSSNRAIFKSNSGKNSRSSVTRSRSSSSSSKSRGGSSRSRSGGGGSDRSRGN